MKTHPAHVVAGGVLLSILFMVPAFELWHGVWPGRGLLSDLNAGDLHTGFAAKRLEARLERNAVLPQVARPYYNEAMFLALGVTVPKVTAGSNGWLFLSSTVRGYPPQTGCENLARTAAAIGAVVRQLEAAGTNVLLVIVPNKASIAFDEVPRLRPPFEPVYDLALDALRKCRVAPFEIRSLVVDEQGARYYKGNTHWKHEAARDVAVSIAAELRRRSGAAGLPGRPVVGEVHFVREFYAAGDLLRMLGFREGGWLEGRMLDNRKVYYGRERSSRRELGSERPEPIALAGTSFSDGYRLASLVAANVGREIEDKGRKGVGPVLPLLEIVESSLRGERDFPEMLIWELPERFLFVGSERLIGPLERLDAYFRFRDHERLSNPFLQAKRIDLRVEAEEDRVITFSPTFRGIARHSPPARSGAILLRNQARN